MPHRLIQDGALVLYGPVGILDLWTDEGFTAVDVLAALTEVEGDLTVRLNSGGGIAFEGVAVFNALKAHDGQVRIEVDALAASAASIIAMAGDEIVMREGAMMMIHNAAGLTFGTSADHAKTIEVLSRLDGQMAGLYARRSGQDRAAVESMMDAETWLTGEEAVAAGLATSTDDAAAEEPTAFAYQIYAHAPERLVALAERRKSRPDDFRRQIAASMAGVAGDLQRKGQPVTDTTDVIRADDTAEENMPPAEDVVETTPPSGKPLTSAEAAEVMEMCMHAGVPSMASALVRQDVHPADAQARIDAAKDIKATVDLARKRCPTIAADAADKYIASGATLEAVRAELFIQLAAGEEVNPRHGNDAATAGKGGRCAVADAAAWDKAVEKVNARLAR